MSILINLSNVERQEQLLQFVQDRRRVSVQEISNRFAISLATARRDLDVLADQDLLKRVHGGAIALRKAPPEPPILQRSQENSDEKHLIGLAGAALVQNGETVILGSGTTVLEVALALKDRPSLTVITNSLLVLNALSGSPGISLISLGGMFRPSELSFIGHITEQALHELRADKVFIGIRAIDIELGLTNDYLPETMTDRAILRAGRRIIVIADHTKCRCCAAAYVAPINAIHTLVTSHAAPAEFVAEIRERGVQVVLV